MPPPTPREVVIEMVKIAYGYFVPRADLDMKVFENQLKAIPKEHKEYSDDLAKAICTAVMKKKEFWEAQKKFPDNDPCCKIYNFCAFYNQPWFIYVAGGAAVFLAILITAIVTIVIMCICMKKKVKKGSYGGGGGKTAKTSKTSKSSTKKSKK